jgi:hypothetical protein
MKEGQFEYSGHLIFSTFHLKLKNQDFSEAIPELLHEIPNYEEGNPENPGEGYIELDIHEFAEKESNLPYWMLDEIKEWTDIRYKWEEYETQEAFVEGDQFEVKISSIHSVDIFFHPSGYALFRGTQSAIHRATSRIEQAAGGEIMLDTANLNIPELIKNINEESNKEHRITFKGAKNASFKSVDAYTDQVSVSGSDVLSDSIVDEAQTKGQIIHLNGIFYFDERSFVSDIRQDKIHIRSSRDLRELPSASRIVISVLFTFEMLEIQDGSSGGEIDD